MFLIYICYIIFSQKLDPTNKLRSVWQSFRFKIFFALKTLHYFKSVRPPSLILFFIYFATGTPYFLLFTSSVLLLHAG